MGAWKSGIFDNDDAADFLDIFESSGLRAVRHALAAIKKRKGKEHLEADTCSYALAAAAIIAAARGHRMPGCPAEVAETAANLHKKFTSDDVAAATTAIERIASNSELKDLYSGRQLVAWKASLKELSQTLSQPAVSSKPPKSTKQLKPVEGWIVSIPLGGGIFGLAKIVFLSKIYKHVMQLAIYPHCRKSRKLPAESLGDFVGHIFASKELITPRKWKPVGELPVIKEERNMSLRMIGFEVWREDNFIRPGTAKDLGKIPSMIVSGEDAAVDRIREALGLPSILV